MSPRTYETARAWHVRLALLVLFFALSLSAAEAFAHDTPIYHRYYGDSSSLEEAKTATEIKLGENYAYTGSNCGIGQWTWTWQGIDAYHNWNGWMSMPKLGCNAYSGAPIHASCDHGGQTLGNASATWCDTPCPDGSVPQKDGSCLIRTDAQNKNPGSCSCDTKAQTSAIPSSAGDPVLFDQGRAVLDEVDYAAASSSVLAVVRHFDTHAPALTGSEPMPLGTPNWTFNYDIRLSVTYVPGGNGNYYYIFWPNLQDGGGRVMDSYNFTTPVGPAQVLPDGTQSCPSYDMMLSGGQCYGLTTPDQQASMRLRIGAQRIYFHKTGDGVTWAPDSDVPGSLVQISAGWEYRDADDSVYRFDTRMLPISKTFRNGQVQTFTTTPSGQIATVADNFGHQLQFSYNGTVLDHFTDPDGRTVKYDYGVTYTDGTDDYTGLKVTYQDGSTRQYPIGLTKDGFVTALVIDENGHKKSAWSIGNTTANYNLVVKSSEGDGLTSLTFSYGLDPNTGDIASVTVTDSQGGRHGYNMASQLGHNQPSVDMRQWGVLHDDGSWEYRGSDGGLQESYDANNNIKQFTDYNGNVTRYTYDLTRNLETQRIEAAGKPEQRTINTRWSTAFRQPEVIAEPLKRTTFAYYDNGSLHSRTEQASTDADGSKGFDATLTGLAHTWTYTYNTVGQVLTSQDPNGNTTTYAYDPSGNGNLLTVSNPMKQVTTLGGYDGSGRVGTITDPNGIVTTLQYDLRGRVHEIDRSAGSLIAKTVYDYYPTGQLKQTTGPDGEVLAYTYDTAHRLTQITDSLGNQITYTLDAAGNRKTTQVTDPKGTLARSVQATFDAYSRLDTTTRGDSFPSQYFYDGNGNPRTDNILIATPNGSTSVHENTRTYDALNRPISERINGVQGQPGYQGQSTYTYDGQSHLTQVTDLRGLPTTYTVDGLGLVSTATSPDSGNTSYTYDLNGNTLTVTDAKQQTTTYTYDALDRLKSETYSDGSKVVYTYDTAAHGIGKLARIDEYDNQQALLRNTTYGYDALGHAASEAHTVAGKTYTLAYGFSAGGRLVSETYPSGRIVTYTLGDMARISGVQLTSKGTQTTLAANATYAPFGGIASFTNGVGQSTTRSYTLAGQVSGYNLGGTAFTVQYDKFLNVQQVGDPLTPANTATYGYDDINRLTTATLPGTTYNYGYDANGNRKSSTPGIGVSYAGGSNQLQSIDSPVSRAVSVDPNGSVTSDLNNAYRYDARGRMIGGTASVGAISFEVNALGQQVRKTTPDSDTIYHYDLLGRLIEETTAAGKATKEYVWLDDMLISVLQ